MSLTNIYVYEYYIRTFLMYISEFKKILSQVTPEHEESKPNGALFKQWWVYLNNLPDIDCYS